MKPLMLKLFPLAVLAAVAGCATPPPLTESRKDAALNTALTRARFDMNCPAATGTVLSSQSLEPVFSGPRYRGPERAEFTIGVEGCGKRETLQLICSEDNSGCVVVDGGRR